MLFVFQFFCTYLIILIARAMSMWETWIMMKELTYFPHTDQYTSYHNTPTGLQEEAEWL